MWQAHGPDEQVGGECLASQNLCQSTCSLASQIVELEEAILGHGVAEGDEQITVVLGIDVGNSPRIPVDLHVRQNRGANFAVQRGDATLGRLQPPTVEVVPRTPCSLAKIFDRDSCAQPLQDLFVGEIQ